MTRKNEGRPAGGPRENQQLSSGTVPLDRDDLLRRGRNACLLAGRLRGAKARDAAALAAALEDELATLVDVLEGAAPLHPSPPTPIPPAVRKRLERAGILTRPRAA